MAEKKVLSLVLEKKWFKKIVSGEKTEEYREIKPYWASRLVNQKAESGEVLFDEFGGYCRVLGEPEYKPFTHVIFYAGYAKDPPGVRKENRKHLHRQAAERHVSGRVVKQGYVHY